MKIFKLSLFLDIGRQYSQRMFHGFEQVKSANVDLVLGLRQFSVLP